MLAEILTESMEAGGQSSNFGSREIPLTEAEAIELIDLLRALLESREFQEKYYFVRALTSPGLLDDKSTRNLFSKGVRERGRQLGMLNAKWESFVLRFNGQYHSGSPWVDTKRMPFEYFLNMEKKLFSNFLADNFLIVELLLLIRELEEPIEQARQAQCDGPVKMEKSLSRLKGYLERGNRLIHRVNLSAAFIAVANSSVFFTTRDWGVAGGISAIGGALLDMKKT